MVSIPGQYKEFAIRVSAGLGDERFRVVETTAQKIAAQGWLMLSPPECEDLPEASFIFRLIEHRTAENRMHFDIRSADGRFKDAKLGVSLSGYLGFYQVAQVTDFWKLEALEPVRLQPGARFKANWRDHLGQRVAAYDISRDCSPRRATPSYWLNVKEGRALDIEIEVMAAR